MNENWPSNRPIWSACDKTRYAAGLGPALLGQCPTACPLHPTCASFQRLQDVHLGWRWYSARVAWHAGRPLLEIASLVDDRWPRLPGDDLPPDR